MIAMPVVIDEVNAEILPEPRSDEPQRPREGSGSPANLQEQVLRAIERERYRAHRLSDR